MRWSAQQCPAAVHMWRALVVVQWHRRPIFAATGRLVARWGCALAAVVPHHTVVRCAAVGIPQHPRLSQSMSDTTSVILLGAARTGTPIVHSTVPAAIATASCLCTLQLCVWYINIRFSTRMRDRRPRRQFSLSSHRRQTMRSPASRSLPFTARSTSSNESLKCNTRCAKRVGIVRAVQLLPATKYSAVMSETCVRIG